VAQQDATLLQHRTDGVNRFAPFGVDADSAASRRRDGYLSHPEEAHVLWGLARQHGGWGGYAPTGERLLSTERGHATSRCGPHDRLRHSHEALRRAAAEHGADVDASAYFPSPVHHLRVSAARDDDEGNCSVRSSSHGESTARLVRCASHPSPCASSRASSARERSREPSPRTPSHARFWRADGTRIGYAEQSTKRTNSYGLRHAARTDGLIVPLASRNAEAVEKHAAQRRAAHQTAAGAHLELLEA
jgi:hypothetical protein